jgi:hypothetical protein
VRSLWDPPRSDLCARHVCRRFKVSRRDAKGRRDAEKTCDRGAGAAAGTQATPLSNLEIGVLESIPFASLRETLPLTSPGVPPRARTIVSKDLSSLRLCVPLRLCVKRLFLPCVSACNAPEEPPVRPSMADGPVTSRTATCSGRPHSRPHPRAGIRGGRRTSRRGSGSRSGPGGAACSGCAGCPRSCRNRRRM